MAEYKFTEDWFTRHTGVWDRVFKNLKPTKFLEIGSFEGRATCHFIENCATYGPLDINCIDTFAGGAGTKFRGFDDVEDRFDHNIDIASASSDCSLSKHKGFSQRELSALIADGKQGYFDLVYVDGSHHAVDVLSDCVLSFALLRVGGYMILDDYLLFETEDDKKRGNDPGPKPAIDAFVNIFYQKLMCLHAPLYQLYVQKIID